MWQYHSSTGEKSMKIKVVLSIYLSAFVAFFCCVFVHAQSNIDAYKDEYDFDEIISSIDDETLQILSEIGIDEISHESIFSVSPTKVFKAIFNIVTGALNGPVRFCVITIGVLILTTLLSSVTDSDESVSLVGGSVIALSAAVPVAQIVTTSFSVLETLGVFTTAFAGVFCAVVSSSGNISGAVAYSSVTVFSNALFSGLLSELSQPVVNAMCSLGFLSCFDFFGFSARFSSTVKKVYVFFMSFVGTVFSGIVTIKGVLSNGADTLTAKGVRFVVGRSLPVVGGTVSETYSALISSLSLIKNTVGIFGIITVVITVLPTLIQLVLWVLCLEITVSVSESFGTQKAIGMLNVLKDTMVLLIATLSIVTAIFIVSVGVVIYAKGGFG